MRQVGETIAAKAAEEAGLRAEAHYHGQAEILRCRHPQGATYRCSRPGITSEQSSREFTPAGSAARTKTAAVQVAGIGPTFSVDPRCRLQRLLRPTPSSIPTCIQGVSSRDVRSLESRLACRLIRIMFEFWRLPRLTCQCRYESCSRSRVMRRSASPPTSSNPTPSPFVKNGCLRFTTRDYERTIELRTHTNRYDDANENSIGSNRRDPPNGSFQSMPLSTTPSMSNATFYPAASSNRFEPRRSLSGIKVGLSPDPDHR